MQQFIYILYVPVRLWTCKIMEFHNFTGLFMESLHKRTGQFMEMLLYVFHIWTSPIMENSINGPVWLWKIYYKATSGDAIYMGKYVGLQKLWILQKSRSKMRKWECREMKFVSVIWINGNLWINIVIEENIIIKCTLPLFISLNQQIHMTRRGRYKNSETYF